MTEELKLPEKEEIYFVDQMLGLVLDIGKSMLECGAQISRVEDTIQSLCQAYGAETVEPWTITSIVQATVRMPDGYHTTQIRRVYETANDLSRLEALNELVRDLQTAHVPLEEAAQKYKAVLQKKTGSLPLTLCGSFLGAGSFAIFVGGDLFDALVSGCVGLVVIALLSLSFRLNLNSIARTVLFCFCGGMLSLLCFSFGMGHNVDKIMIGTIMLFTPGILLGNAVKDMLCGDLIAGTLKLLQAIITSVAIAVGYAAAMWLMGGLFA